MDFFKTSHIMLGRILMSSLGLWPYLNCRAQYSRRIFVFAILSSAIFFQTAKLFTVNCTLKLAARIIPFLMVSIGAMIKFIAHCINDDSIRELLDCVKYDWDNFKSKEEIAIMEKCLKPGLYLNQYWATSIYVTLWFSCLMSLYPPILDYFIPLNESRAHQQLFLLECFVDEEKYYYYVLIFSWISAFITLTVIIATKVTYVSNILHVTGILGIAGYRFKHVYDNIKSSNPNDLYEIRGRLHSGVATHKKAIRLTIQINECYGMIDFSNCFLLPVPTISLCLYCSRLLIAEWREMLPIASITFALIVSLFIYLYPGQMMINASSAVLEDVYCSMWYTASPNAQKLLLLVLHRAAIPNTIILGNFITASMDTYAAVLQSCLSYFTVLCSLR